MATRLKGLVEMRSLLLRYSAHLLAALLTNRPEWRLPTILVLQAGGGR